VPLYRYRRLIRYPLRQWPALVMILGLTAATSAITALQPWPLKILVDYALAGKVLPTSLRSILEGLSLATTPPVLIVAAALASLGLFALSIAINAGLSWAWTSAGQRMVYDLATSFFHRLQRLSLIFHSRNRVGDLLSRLTEDTYCVYAAAEGLLVSPGQCMLTLITISVVAWRLDPQLTLLSLVAAPVLAGSAVFFGRRLKKRSRQDREAKSRLVSFVHQTLTSIPVVQAFDTRNWNQHKYRAYASDAVAISQSSTLMKHSYEIVNGLTTAVGTAIVLYAGGQRVLSEALSIGSLLVFIAYLRSMDIAFRGLLQTYGKMKFVEASFERVMEVMESEDGLWDSPTALLLPIHSKGECGHVRLEEITFGYEPGRTVLQDVTLGACPGETVALVGKTGAGKSTLVSLIPRFFDPWQGRVMFDGVDIREIQISSLRAQVAIVLQEPFLLPLTVAQNIAYGRPGASREEILEAAVVTNADEFIQQLPQGYDTVIGEKGATLSEGQKQRLAIARALLKDAPVLILDEPTSALDAHTETLLLGALDILMKGRTTFIIAHRLSTVRRADRIVVLDQGRLVESGTHNQLLEEGGLYKRLHAYQTSPMSEEVAA